MATRDRRACKHLKHVDHLLDLVNDALPLNMFSFLILYSS